MQPGDELPRQRKAHTMPRVEDDVTPQRTVDEIRASRKRQERLGRRNRRAISDFEEEQEDFEVKRDKEESSAWLDGPLALTLLPPLGSFLTGGDFVRDVLVLALLFYYLRALIKTPWELYTRARARRSPAGYEEDLESEEEDEPDHIRQIRALARSELRLAELTYLALCLLTPLIGTVLLRYVGSLLSASGSLSWFSTGLFVLATGVRPWRHLISLLTNRAEALHDIVYAPKIRKQQARGRRTPSDDERERQRDARTREAVEAAILLSTQQNENTRRDLRESDDKIAALESQISSLATSLDKLATRPPIPPSPTTVQMRTQRDAALQAQLETHTQSHSTTETALAQLSTDISTLETSLSALQVRVRTQEEVVEDAQTNIRSAVRSSDSMRQDMEIRVEGVLRGLADLERRLENEGERRAGDDRSTIEGRGALETRVRGIETSLESIINVLKESEKKATEALVSANSTAAKLAYGLGKVNGDVNEEGTTYSNVHPLVWTGGNGTTAQRRLSSSGNLPRLSSVRDDGNGFSWPNPLSPTKRGSSHRVPTSPGDPSSLKTRSRSRSSTINRQSTYVLASLPYDGHPLLSIRGIQARVVKYTLDAILFPVKVSQGILKFVLNVLGRGVKSESEALKLKKAE